MREQWNNETNKQINKLHQQQQQKKHNSITYMEYLAFVFAMISPVRGDQDRGSRWGKVFYDKIC